MSTLLWNLKIDLHSNIFAKTALLNGRRSALAKLVNKIVSAAVKWITKMDRHTGYRPLGP